MIYNIHIKADSVDIYTYQAISSDHHLSDHEFNLHSEPTSQQTFVGLEDVLKICLEDVLKTYLEDILKILWRQTKYLLGTSVYLSGDKKSKCVSNKSVFHKSISDNSNANSKCIN